MPTSLEQLLRYCQETHGKSASLLELLKKEKGNEKEAACCMQMFCSTSAQKSQSRQQASSSCFAPNTCFNHVYMFTAAQAHLDPAQYTQ